MDSPPPGEQRLRVRGEAAHELVTLLESCTEADKTEIIGKVLPCLVGLIIVDQRDASGRIIQPGMPISTPDIRREVLALFNNLLLSGNFKSMVIGHLTQEQVRRELHRLKMQVMEQAKKKQQKHKNLNPLPTDADLNPLDEEVSKYIKHIVDQMSLEINDVFSDLDENSDPVDNEHMPGEDGIDPQVKEKLDQLKQQKAHASEDKDNISAGLVAMQQKLMEMEEDKLNVDCQSTKKKVFKIVVVGDVHVGKTSLIYRYCKQKKPDNVSATLGCEYSAKRVERPDQDTTILLQIFDIQGLERYRKQAPRAFFKDAHGAVVVFDCHKDAAESFYGAQEWKQTVDERFEENKRGGAPCILIANKSDYPPEDRFAFVRSPAKMERCCRDNNFISWHATSSFDGRGLREVQDSEQPTAFDSLVDQLLLWDEQGKFDVEQLDSVDLEDEGQQPPSLCAC